MPNVMRIFLFLSLLCSFIGFSGADVAGIEFSASVVQSQPDGKTNKGRVYVGKNFIRSEFERNGKPFIRLVDNDKRVAYVILPEQKGYFQEPGNNGITPSGANRSPCQGRPKDVCKRSGNEAVYGRAANKWHIATDLRGQRVTGTVWLDAKRGIPLREEWSNGTKMERHMVSIETIQGRQAEKWQTTHHGAKGQTQQTMEWYDPVLKLAIKEQFGQGWVRALRDIKEGPQPASLFTIPSGYRNLSPQPSAAPTP